MRAKKRENEFAQKKKADEDGDFRVTLAAAQLAEITSARKRGRTASFDSTSDPEKDSDSDYSSAPAGGVCFTVRLSAGGSKRKSVINNVSSWPLNENELDNLAKVRGWDKQNSEFSKAPMSSYRRGTTLLNFWLTTGTVGSYLNHPRQKKTQLFRRAITMQEAVVILDNPRQHTGKGYQTRERERNQNNVPQVKQHDATHSLDIPISLDERFSVILQKRSRSRSRGGKRRRTGGDGSI